MALASEAVETKWHSKEKETRNEYLRNDFFFLLLKDFKLTMHPSADEFGLIKSADSCVGVVKNAANLIYNYCPKPHIA